MRAPHTPTPWEAGRVLKTSEGMTWLYFDEQVEVFPPDAGPGECQHSGPLFVVSINTECGAANLALLLAAPRMLAMLKEVLSGVADSHLHGGPDRIAKIQAVVDEATITACDLCQKPLVDGGVKDESDQHLCHRCGGEPE